jgi:hypothetical protein
MRNHRAPTLNQKPQKDNCNNLRVEGHYVSCICVMQYFVTKFMLVELFLFLEPSHKFLLKRPLENLTYRCFILIKRV